MKIIYLFAAMVVLLVVPSGVLAGIGFPGETVLEFDTELTSLDLTGGPYPIPVGSDPGNLLFPDVGGGLAADGGLASIEGYSFVDSLVSITLSSQRVASPGPPLVPPPGPQSLGHAFAFQGQPELNAVQQGAPPLPPIDPDELDGEQFIVDSFFDVFFDITVTDVDTRPGRDYAGQPDGASFQFLDNNSGPEDPVRSFHTAIFDKDAPNFGLLPPPQSDPYIGEFEIEIPLGADINGNLENDKIKFTIASHAAGDGNRQFIILPDGTVIDEFDSAAFIEGAVVDESTDPPFTLGAGSAFAPAFTGPGALIGPTTATSNLLNPLVGAVPEPSSFALAALSLLSLGFVGWRRRQR